MNGKIKIQNKLYNLFKYSKNPVKSFTIAAICMFLALSHAGVLSTGKYSLLDGDLLSIYIPAIKNLCRDMVNGTSIDYSWTMGMGMNTSLYNAYYSYSPFNILFIILGRLRDDTITAILIIMKTGIAAFCFHLFLREVHNIDGDEAICFSVFYSMCSFQVSYNVINIMWLDSMYVLPLVLMFVYRFHKKKKWIGLVIWYAYAFISQFYMGYVIGIFSLLYFILLIVLDNEKGLKKAFLEFIQYIWIVALAVGISAWVWIPALEFIVSNKLTNIGEFNVANIHVIDILRRLFWGEIDGMSGGFPNIYCGIPALLLLPYFFICKRINTKEKILYSLLLGILVISCVFKPVYILWHGFEVPNGWNYRFAYIISFVICVIAAMTANRLVVRTGLKKYIPIGAIMILMVVLMRDSDSRRIIVNAIIVFIWTIIFGAYCVCTAYNRKYVSWILLLLTACECILCGYMGFNGSEELKPDMYRVMYDVWHMGAEEAKETLDSDANLYRINYLNDYSSNAGTYFDFNGIGYFSPAENINVRRTLSKLGLYTTPRAIYGYGLTPVTKMLLDIRYDIYGTIVKYDFNENDLHPRIIRNDPVLTVGYLVEGNEEDYRHIEDTDAFANLNNLISTMTGEEINTFRKIAEDRISVREQGMKLVNDQDGYEIIRENNGENSSLEFRINMSDAENAYTYVDNGLSQKSSGKNVFLMENGDENRIRDMGELSVSYIKPMQSNGEDYVLRIVPVGDISWQKVENFYFYTFDEAELKKAYDIIADNELDVTEFCDGYVKGRIVVDKSCRFLFTTIPYEKGWSVWINGIKQDIIPTLDESFIAVEMPGNGMFDVEFIFEPPGRKLGTIITVISIMSLMITLIFMSMIRKIEEAKGYICA